MRKDMKFGKNDEAVSPVIGVILMVAITVILAAVIAAFVFGMGTPEKTPMANMQMKRAQVSSNQIIFTHSGGETVTLSDVKLIISNGSLRTTVNPLLPFGSTTALPPGSELKLNFDNDTKQLANISIDDVPYTPLGNKDPNNYKLDRAGVSVTVEFWYIPSGQMLGKLEGATIS